MRLPDAFRSVRLLSRLHLLLLSVFAGLGLAAFMLSRLEILAPSAFLWSGPLLAPLRGLAWILLFFFVVLPAVPAVWGLSLLQPADDRVAHPRLAAASCVFWGLGGVCLLWAVFLGRVSPDWLADLGSPITRDNVPLPQLLAILFACGATEFLALRLLMAGRQMPRHDLDFARCALLAGSALAFLALPLLASVAFAGLLERLLGIPLFGSSSAPSGLPLALGVVAASPLQMAIALPVLGLCAARLSDAQRLAPLRIWIFRLALLSLFAVQLRGWTSNLPALLALSATACHCLLTAGLSMLVARVGLAWLRAGAALDGERPLALAALACLFWFLPIDLWIHLVTASGAYGDSHLLLAHHLLLGAGVLFAVVGVPARGAPAGRQPAWVAVTLLLLLATLAALLRLAATAIPAALPLASRGDLAALLATALAGSAFFLLALLHLRHAFRRLRPY